MRLARALCALVFLFPAAGCDSSGGTTGTVTDTVAADATDDVVEDTSATTTDTTTTTGEDTGGGTGYHPAGWSAPDVHGVAFNAAGPATCTGCHGADLTGGTAVSCATCHAAASADWTTDCTFCHGGADNDTGAPPEAIDGTLERSFLGVGAHSAHVVDTATHAAFACTTCHPALPDSVFSAGHIDGDGVAENAFAGIAAATSFDLTAATCSTVYCHGNGQGDNGSAVWTSTTAMTCSSCHPTTGTGMSGEHRKHISHNVKCSSCHADVASGSSSIIDVDLHVNGTPDIHLSQGTYDATTRRCSGVCHGAETW
ncbi:MAG: CxxxxCH/CxxCH domain-containing protein [Deltaproteobacteria bacterium]|nr:MAG: CxxxxCH/CxxCH domain-containing protein [Deltaproteobacteria bacterium]